MSPSHSDVVEKKLRKPSFHSVVTHRGSNGEGREPANEHGTAQRQTDLDALNRRRRSGGDFRIEFSEQGDKFRGIQQWLNESILDSKSITPILPIPGNDSAHRTLPTFASREESTSNHNLHIQILSQ